MIRIGRREVSGGCEIEKETGRKDSKQRDISRKNDKDKSFLFLKSNYEY